MTYLARQATYRPEVFRRPDRAQLVRLRAEQGVNSGLMQRPLLAYRERMFRASSEKGRAPGGVAPVLLDPALGDTADMLAHLEDSRRSETGVQLATARGLRAAGRLGLDPRLLPTYLVLSDDLGALLSLNPSGDLGRVLAP